MLYLTENDVDALIDMESTVAVVERAFGALAAAQAQNVPRFRARAPGIVLHSMSAAAEYLGVVGWKQYTTTLSGARFHVALYDAQSGDWTALVEANRLGQLRTGAVTAIAAKWLAAPDVREIGLFGAGYQAQGQLEAMAATCELQKAIVYSRQVDRRNEFAREASEKHGIEVVPAAMPRQAVEDLPVVITATNSPRPVFDGNWLSPQSLVCAVGSNWLNKTELDVATIRRAQLVVCDSCDACRLEAGDFAAALAEGEFNWSRAVDLAEVVSETIPANPEAVTLFKSVGLAITDIALAAELVNRAQQAGRGKKHVFA